MKLCPICLKQDGNEIEMVKVVIQQCNTIELTCPYCGYRINKDIPNDIFSK
jgi:hypothetical protein